MAETTILERIKAQEEILERAYSLYLDESTSPERLRDIIFCLHGKLTDFNLYLRYTAKYEITQEFAKLEPSCNIGQQHHLNLQILADDAQT